MSLDDILKESESFFNKNRKKTKEQDFSIMCSDNKMCIRFSPHLLCKALMKNSVIKKPEEFNYKYIERLLMKISCSVYENTCYFVIFRCNKNFVFNVSQELDALEFFITNATQIKFSDSKGNTNIATVTPSSIFNGDPKNNYSISLEYIGDSGGFQVASFSGIKAQKVKDNELDLTSCDNDYKKNNIRINIFREFKHAETFLKYFYATYLKNQI